MSQDGAPQPRVVRGTVTPSRASRFFLPRTRAAPPTPETPALSISYSTPYAPTPSSAGTPRSAADVPRAWARPLGSDSEDDDENAPPPSPTLACKRRRLAPAPAAPAELPPSAPAAVRRPSRGAAPCAVLHRLRTHAPRFRMPHPTSHTPFFSRMTTREAYPYTLESEVPLAMASPLCVAYMHRARDADDPLPCLAVGDDEGRVHLLDTRVPADALDQRTSPSDPAYVRHTTKPLVHGSLFALEWRADDAVLALGGSDYSVAAWDVQHEVCVASYDAHEGSARALAWDPCGGGRLLASGARDGAIYLWDVRQAAPAVHIPRAHRLPRTKRGARSAGVTSLVFRSDGQLVSAASEHGVLHSWDWRAPVRPSAQSADVSLRGAQNTRPHGVSSLAYAPRRARLYAACTDGRYVGD